MKRLWKWFLRLVLMLAVFAGIEALLLRHPSAFFKWSATIEGYSLYSDRSFDQTDALQVLKSVKAGIERSELYKPGEKHAAFICNSRWRRLIFFIGDSKASGLNYSPLTTNVFLSGAQVDENRLISRVGKKAPGEMTLAYCISHEFAHSLTMEHLGIIDYWRMPAWIREGYADVVARGSVFKRPEARVAYLANAKEMNRPAAAPYLRYNILLGHLLEQERMSLEDVFYGRMIQAEAEEKLRRFLQAQS